MQPQQEYVLSKLRYLGSRGATRIESAHWSKPVINLGQRANELALMGFPVVAVSETHSDGHHMRYIYKHSTNICQRRSRCECGSWYRRGDICNSCSSPVGNLKDELSFCKETPK